MKQKPKESPFELCTRKGDVDYNGTPGNRLVKL